jgi:hypothetical protein
MVVNDTPLALLVLSPEKEEIFHSGHSEILVKKQKSLVHSRELTMYYRLFSK